MNHIGSLSLGLLNLNCAGLVFILRIAAAMMATLANTMMKKEWAIQMSQMRREVAAQVIKQGGYRKEDFTEYRV